MPSVLLQSRTTLFSVPGGDTIQVLKTAEYLRLRGWEADVSTSLDCDVRPYDLVHLFNLTRPQETLIQALNAHAHGKPICLSTIYLDWSEFDRSARGGVAGAISRLIPPSTCDYLKVAARALTNAEIHRGTLKLLMRGYRRSQRDLLKLTTLLLPNSESEIGRVWLHFPESRATRYRVVPNAFDASLFFDKTSDANPLESKYKDCVLCVARIEGRKEQLNLVRALRSTDLKLVLIGKPAPNNLAYFDQVKSEMGANVEILGEIPHQNLPRYYAACKVHALVSWFETTGLSSLEAAAMGANIVITDRGDTTNYFRNLAFYCDPADPDSIRDAVLAAHRAPKTNALQKLVQEHYTWEKTAQATIEAYESILKGKAGRVC